jgi:RimJ/RimL family protein N-acetyltransferase
MRGLGRVRSMSTPSVDGQRGRRPAGYPSEFERQVSLRDGRIVDVRPVVPDDAAELSEAIRTADADTVSRRFLGGPPSVTPALLDYLTVLDYRTRFGLVARDRLTGRGVGIARYEQVGDGAAEVAVVVHPGWRRVGLATALVHLLAEAALARGISTFTASFLTDNHPVAALLADAGVGAAGFIADGIAEVQIPLAGSPTPPDRRTNRPRAG